MGVGVESLLDGFVAEVLADGNDGYAFVYQYGCAAVAQIVDADAFYVRFLCGIG